MSLHEYEASKKLGNGEHPFYGLIMGAMRQADTDNAAKLKAAFPDQHAELQARYNAPGGLLEATTWRAAERDEQPRGRMRRCAGSAARRRCSNAVEFNSPGEQCPWCYGSDNE